MSVVGLAVLVIAFIYVMAALEWIKENPLFGVLIISAIVIAVIYVRKYREKRRQELRIESKPVTADDVNLLYDSKGNRQGNTLVDVDLMSGESFEQIVAEILKGRGYTNINLTPQSGDHGVDILAYKGIFHYAIQCKRYTGNVGNKAVQEAFAGKHFYGADYAVVVTNARFTNQAKEEAQKLGVELWDRSWLNDALKNG